MTAKAARRRLQPAERRSIILEEALRQFAERHYSVVTVREIALSCEINVALIYHYFDSKEALVRCALGHAIERVVTAYEERRAPSADPLAEISAWLDAHIALAPMVTQQVKLMADYAASGLEDAEIDRLIDQFYDGERTLLEGALSKGIAHGIFRPLDVARTARRIGLLLDGIFYASASRGDDRIEQDIEDVAQYLRELRAGAAAPGT